MVKDILYTTANDTNGNLVRIGDATKGDSYFCPECNGKMAVKRSGKTGRGSRRPHFSHNALTSNCTPEGVLHSSFKKFSIALLEESRVSGDRFVANWICKYCEMRIAGNLLHNITRVAEEHNLSFCRPDIALLDSGGNVFAVIEIVVTHPPEDNTLYYYKEADVVLIQIDLTSDDDLNHIKEKLLTPSLVDYCYNPACSNYAPSTTRRGIQVTRASCGRCFSPIERYSIEISTPFGSLKSNNFTDKEIDLVRSLRTNIEVRKNPRTKEKHPVFVCTNCKRFRSIYRPNPRL